MLLLLLAGTVYDDSGRGTDYRVCSLSLTILASSVLAVCVPLAILLALTISFVVQAGMYATTEVEYALSATDASIVKITIE